MMKMPPFEKAPPEFDSAACDLLLSDEALCDAAGEYAAFVIAPPLLARRLRARGDEKASARDFECVCPTSPATDRPCCQKTFADCRFAGAGECERPPANAPSDQIFFSALVDIAYAYANTPPAARGRLLALLTKATEKRLARIQKSRRAGARLAARAGDGPPAE